jgi:D-3-phosphoglycerate dehydrogenase
MAGMLLSARGIIDGMNYVQSLVDLKDPAEMSPLVEKAKSRFAGHEIAARRWASSVSERSARWSPTWRWRWA